MPLEAIGPSLHPPLRRQGRRDALWRWPVPVARFLRRGGLAVVLLGLVAAAWNPTSVDAASFSGAHVVDGFGRSLADRWGDPELGGSYVLGGPVADYDVAGGVGMMRLPTAGSSRSATLPDVLARDLNVQVRIRPDKAATGYGQYLYVALRRNKSSGAEYRIRMRIAGGAVYLAASRWNGSSDTVLASEVRVSGLSVGAGTTVILRAQATGASPTTLRIRAWLAGQTEPSAWQYSASDSTAALQVAGGVALRSALSSSVTNAPVVFSFDDFWVTMPSVSAPVAASAYYVSTSGNDANDGSLGRPWRTLQHAAGVAGPSTIHVRGGSYPGFVLRRSGLTFAEYSGETAVLTGSNEIVLIDKVSSAAIRGFTIENGTTRRGSGIRVNNSSGVTIQGNLIRNNRSYGVRLLYTKNSVIRDNEVTKNDVGVQVSYTSDGVQVLNNRIHHNDRLIDSSFRDSGGGNGVVFLNSTGRVVAKGNQVWANRAPDPYNVYDGSAFEIFGSSDVTITENVMWDNKHVLETGTNGPPCNNILFTRNVAYGAGSVAGYTRGLLIACGSNSLFANNTVRGFDQSQLSIVRKADYIWQGSVDGLKVINNIFQADKDHVYYLDNVPTTVLVDDNLLYNSSGGSLLYMVGKGSTSSFSTLRLWTGMERTGLNAGPRFVSPGTHDYHLQTTSPAIDRGSILQNITNGYLGAYPDYGRYETR